MRRLSKDTSLSDEVQDAAVRACNANEISSVLRHAGLALVALETELTAVKKGKDDARDVLAEAMTTTGLTSIALAYHDMSVPARAKTFTVVDEGLVPAEYWDDPPPPPPPPPPPKRVLSRDRIMADLEQGVIIDGIEPTLKAASVRLTSSKKGTRKNKGPAE